MWLLVLRRTFAAELLGTGLLVFFGVGMAALMFGFDFAKASLAAGATGTALAFGLAQLVIAYGLGAVHVNPAVTVGVLLTLRISIRDAIIRCVAQFAGGILASLLLWGVFSCSPLYTTSHTGLGVNGWGESVSALKISLGGAFLTEVILTATFVFIVLCITSSKNPAPAAGGVAIGLALTLVHLVGIPITGTSVNPARSLGPAVIVRGLPLRQVWLFIVAPLTGGALAAAVYWVLVYPEELNVEQDATKQAVERLGDDEVP